MDEQRQGGLKMKVEVDIKITVLEGEEAGRTFTQKTVGETEPEYTEYGTIERLRFEWNHIHNMPSISKSCSNCKFWLMDNKDEEKRCKYCSDMDEWISNQN